MRNNEWLIGKLDSIWLMLFPEVERKNKVIVRFKGKWKNKFGHIKQLKDGSSEIVVNGLFVHELVPEYIIDITLAHELIHYMHGFNSPYEQKYKYPHQGGVVDKELLRRGFGHWVRQERDFIKKDWLRIYKFLKTNS